MLEDLEREHKEKEGRYIKEIQRLKEGLWQIGRSGCICPGPRGPLCPACYAMNVWQGMPFKDIEVLHVLGPRYEENVKLLEPLIGIEDDPKNA